jgi:hypothetical protein
MVNAEFQREVPTHQGLLPPRAISSGLRGDPSLVPCAYMIQADGEVRSRLYRWQRIGRGQVRADSRLRTGSKIQEPLSPMSSGTSAMIGGYASNTSELRHAADRRQIAPTEQLRACLTTRLSSLVPAFAETASARQL